MTCESATKNMAITGTRVLYTESPQQFEGADGRSEARLTSYGIASCRPILRYHTATARVSSLHGAYIMRYTVFSHSTAV